MDKFLKITYNITKEKKVHIYRPLRSKYASMKEIITNYLFKEKKMPVCDIRIFWVDAQNDEIDIITQSDFQAFVGKSCMNPHIHVEVFIDNRSDVEGSEENDDPAAKPIPLSYMKIAIKGSQPPGAPKPFDLTLTITKNNKENVNANDSNIFYTPRRLH